MWVCGELMPASVLTLPAAQQAAGRAARMSVREPTQRRWSLLSLLHRTAGELEHPLCRDSAVEKASPAVAISLNHRLNYCFSQTFKRLPSTDSDAVQECRQASEANKPDNRMNFARRSDRVL